MMGGVRADEAEKVEMEFMGQKKKTKGKGKGNGLAPTVPLPPIIDADEDEFGEQNAGNTKKRKTTTAADVRLQMDVAAKDKNRAASKEIKNMRSIFSAYMRHGLLRPILDSELGPQFFKRVPGSKDELEWKLSEIRSVFNRAGIHDNIIAIILYLSNAAELYLPIFSPGVDLRGLTMEMRKELDDMGQLIAEVECEYGAWLEAGLAKRLLMKLAAVVKNIMARNQLMNFMAPMDDVPAAVVATTTTTQAKRGRKPKPHHTQEEEQQ